MASFTSQASGNASAGSTWVGGVAPSDGDTIIIAAGHTVTQDVNRIYGSNASAVGHAINIQATNSATYGVFIVNSGVTLTLRGTDQTSNTLMLVNQYAQFTPAGGSTIVGDVATDFASFILNKGIISAIGSAGNLVNFTSPVANYSWSNAVTGETVTSSNAYVWGPGQNIAIRALVNPWISNAAGTGIGSFGDTSLSFSSVSPVGILATEVSSRSAVTAAGDYWVDYDAGLIYFYFDYSANISFTAAYKHLTLGKGWGIDCEQNTAYNSGDFQYCAFSYMGTNDNNTPDSVIYFAYKASASSAANRLANVQHCTVTYCGRWVSLRGCTGTAADPILVDSNTINTTWGNDSAGYVLTFHPSTASSYCSFTNNTLNTRYKVVYYRSPAPIGSDMAGLHMDGNAGKCVQLFLTDNNLSDANTFSDATIANNTLEGLGDCFDYRVFQAFGGTSGHPALVYGNTFTSFRRIGHYSSHFRYYDNFSLRTGYYRCLAGSMVDDVRLTDISIYNNLFAGAEAGSGGKSVYAGTSIELGYDHRNYIDGVNITNNTFVGNTYGAIGIGDSVLSGAGTAVVVNLAIENNIIINAQLGGLSTGGYGIVHQPDGTNNLTRVHVLELGYNALYNNVTNYQGFNGPGSFTTTSGKYNYLTSPNRNITGVGLWNPSYTTAQTGKSLVYTVTSLGVTETLAWDGGVAVSIIFGNGTASAAGTNNTVSSLANVNSTFTDSTQTWSTNKTLSTCPSGRWMKITSGVAAGYIGAITNNAATTLTVVPSFATAGYSAPAIGDSYTIYESEVSTLDSGGIYGITAGIYLPSFPTMSQTDTGIDLAFHDVTTNPLIGVGTGDDSSTVTDYKSSSGSPCIDAGTSTNAPSADYFGTTRPQGSAVDIGFYEYVAATGGPWPWFIKDFISNSIQFGGGII